MNQISRIGMAGGSLGMVALMLSLTLAAMSGCGSGDAAPSGNIAFEEAEFPAELVAGQSLSFDVSVYTETPKQNVEVTLELLPLTGVGATSVKRAGKSVTIEEALALVPGSEEYEAVAAEIGGAFFNTTQEGEVATETMEFRVPVEVLPGEYLPVLRINKRGRVFSQDGDQAESSDDLSDNFIRGVLPITVVAPEVPNLSILQFDTTLNAFTLHPTVVEGPVEDDDPFPGVETEDEPHLTGKIIVKVESMAVSVPVEVLFEIGLTDELGATTWTPLQLIERSVANEIGTTLVDRLVYPVDDTAGVSFDVSRMDEDGTALDSLDIGDQEGVGLEFWIPLAVRVALLEMADDVAISIRATVDPDNDILEFREGVAGTLPDNQAIATVFHLAADEAVVEDGRGSQASAILEGTRLDPWVRYSKIALDPSRGEEFGDRGALAVGYHIGSVLSYDTKVDSTIAAKAKFATDNYLSAWVFHSRFDFLRVQAAAEIDSEDLARSYSEYRVTVLGHTRYADFKGMEANDKTLVVKTLISAGNGLTVGERKEIRSNIWIGPVPIAVTAGSVGSLGIKAAVSVMANNLLRAEAGPFIEISGTASASIDVFFASAGIHGTLTLLKVDMKFRGDIQIFASGNNAKLALAGPMSMTTMSGRVFLKVSWDLFFWRGSEEFTIARWKGYTKNWNWFAAKKWSF